MIYIKAKILTPIKDEKFGTKALFLTNYKGVDIIVKNIHPLTKDGKLNKWFLVDSLGKKGYYPADFIYHILPKKFILNFKINYLTK